MFLKSAYEYLLMSAKNRILRISQNETGEFWTLHRVSKSLDDRNLQTFNDLYVTEEDLESKILTYKENGYEFISIDSMVNRANNFSKKRFVVLTIDDGFKDTVYAAYPILKKHSIPFVWYVSSDFIDKKILMWWDFLNDLIKNNDYIHLSNNVTYKCISDKSKNELYISLSKNILKMGPDIEKNFSEIFNVKYTDIVSKYAYLLADWNDVINLNEDKLCTIAAHTKTHLGLKFCSRQYVLKDFIDSKNDLEHRLGIPIDHLAYPFGTHYSVGNREYKLAKLAGFKSATIQFSTSIYKYHYKKMHCIPRKSMSSN